MTAAPAIQPKVTAGDRLGLTLFLAIAFHALVILGISFQSEDAPKSEIINTLDVTLVQTASDTAPEKADYIAQEQQKGGGNTQERVRHEPQPEQPSVVEQPAPSQQNTPAAAPPAPKRTAPQIVTQKESPKKTPQETAAPQAPAEAPAVSAAELMQRSREIARIEARLETSKRLYSQSQSKVLTANTRKAEDAAYLNAWIRKVEQIGSLNYPDEARRKNLSGELEMEVTLNADGSLVDIEVIRSSGQEVLDEAARRIVRLAAPFAAVPDNVLDGDQQLRIRRRWRFTTQDQLVGQ